MLEIITKILTISTLGSQILLVFLVLYGIIRRRASRDYILKIIKKYGIGFAFIIALVATLGSLYYSEIAKFAPCKLCWFQRIFMYPQIILLGLAWWKQDFNIKKYSMTLAIIGSAFALYHSYIQQFPNAKDTFCAIGGLTGCSTRFIYEFGYITMPLMSLTAFLMIIFFLTSWQRNNPES